MDEDELISVLDGLEDDAKGYIHGPLAAARALATAEYYQIPPAEDDKDDGLSKFVTSETQNSIEWVLPALIKMFTGGEKAVEFEPRTQEDEEGAGQATEACNYVFYRQNPGFIVLHNAIKDALMLRNGAITWRWDEKVVKEEQKFRQISLDELVFTLEKLGKDGEAELTSAEQVTDDVQDPMSGQIIEPARYNVRISVLRKQGKIKLDAVPPEKLLIYREWHIPLLQDCPYVAILERATLSELRQQGYDVEAGDLPNESDTSDDEDFRAEISGDFDGRVERADEAMQSGLVRREWVLIDFDGDGIAERRHIVRLAGKILYNEPCDHVPVANGAPILRQHRWDGLSLADVLADIQKLSTEVTRQVLNSLYFSITPRQRVLTDAQGVPQANVDDMLNFTPGGYVREKVSGAVQPMDMQFVGAQAMPIMELVGKMSQDRTGINQYFQGNSTDALNKTASGTAMLTQATQQRVELIARMLAETLVMPTFHGILKLLIEYQMEPLSFRLNNKYVRMDPQEWRDQYDLIINVGLGTGNKDQTLMHLGRIQQMQLQMMQLGVQGTTGPLVLPKNLLETCKKIILNSGISNPEAFFNDPGELPPPQPPQPPPDIVKTQMTLQAKAQEDQAARQADQQKSQAGQDFEARKIMAAQQHAKDMVILQAQLDAEKSVQQAQIQGEQAERQEMSGARMLEHKTGLDRMGQEQSGMPTERDQLLAQVAEALREVSKPKKIRIVRDAQGRATGAEPVEEQPNGGPFEPS